MKTKNYVLKSLLAAALLSSGLTGMAQTHQKLQDDGKPVQLNPVVTGFDKPESGCDSIKTTFAAGNGLTGVMFNVVAKAQIYLTTFVVSTTGGGTDTAKVFYLPGSCIGHDASSAGWVLASNTTVKSGGTADTLIQANALPLNYNMNAGDTVGIYITYTGVLSVAYTNGTNLDSIYAKKSTIQVLQGYGKGYPFAGSFSPRVFNGIVNFCPGVAGINEINKTAPVALFPNPFSSTATLKIPENITLTNLKLVISDISGRIVSTQKVSAREIIIDRGNLTSGMYFYTLLQNNSAVGKGKVVIQ